MKEKYTKNQVWKDSNRMLCKIEEDGTVTFVDDITEEELRWTVTELLRQREQERQLRMDNWEKGVQHLALGDITYLNEDMGLYNSVKPV